MQKIGKWTEIVALEIRLEPHRFHLCGINAALIIVFDPKE